jgi:hypothetical protein
MESPKKVKEPRKLVLVFRKEYDVLVMLKLKGHGTDMAETVAWLLGLPAVRTELAKEGIKA